MLKKFLLKVFLISVTILAVILYINVRVDSAFVVRDKERNMEIAKILLSGKNAAVKFIPSKWADLQMAYIKEQINEHKTVPYDILVFGSSYSSELRADFFPQNSFFNCVLPGGGMPDYIALYGIYKKNKLLPKYLFINITASTFHSLKTITVNGKIQNIADPSTPMSVSPALEQDYNVALSYLHIKPDSISKQNRKTKFINKITGLLSISYFQLNCKSLFDKMIIPTSKEKLKSYFVVRKDGGYSLKAQSDVNSNEVMNASRSFVDIHKSGYFVSSDTSSIYFEYFTKLLLQLREDNVIPIIYISPTTPIVYDGLADAKGAAIEIKIRSFCKEHSIVVIGSFNPHLYGYDQISNLWLDPGHPVTSLVNDILYRHKQELEAIGIHEVKKIGVEL